MLTVDAPVRRQCHLWPLTPHIYHFSPYKSPQALVRAMPVGTLQPLQVRPLRPRGARKLSTAMQPMGSMTHPFINEHVRVCGSQGTSLGVTVKVHCPGP